MKKSPIVLPFLAASLIGAGYAGGSILTSEMAEASPTKTLEEEDHTEAETKPGSVQGSRGDEYESADAYELAKNLKVVRVGQIIVPVYKPSSVSYVVAEILSLIHI